MEGGLCYFHANPDKASELGKRGGTKSPTGTLGVAEYVARPLKSVDDVTRLLADTIRLTFGTIDSRLANTVGFLATGMLKAFIAVLGLLLGRVLLHRAQQRVGFRGSCAT